MLRTKVILLIIKLKTFYSKIIYYLYDGKILLFKINKEVNCYEKEF